MYELAKANEQGWSVSETQKKLSPALWQRISRLYKDFGDNLTAFLVKLPPTTQLNICTNEEQCYVGNYPSLGLLKTAYGEKAPIVWLIPQLVNLSEFCGVKEKLNGSPLEECAHIIANNYVHLKTSELMLFFYRFKSGRYGTFYGNVDPLVIMTALQEFIKERNLFYTKYEQKERQKQEEERAKKPLKTLYEYYKELGRDVRKYDPKGSNDKKAVSPKVAYNQAQTIINNTLGLDGDRLLAMANDFKRRVGVSPMEYIERYATDTTKD